jgi:cephalosporin hydroxylase
VRWVGRRILDAIGAERAYRRWVEPLILRRAYEALIARTDNFGRLTWLGVPIWQPILDLWTIQETLFEIKPDLVIECGTNRGGSSFFFGQLFDLMGRGRVITIDVQKMHALQHPRVTYLIGSSVAPEIVSLVSREVAETLGPVVVILDSDHSASHVANELAAYHRFVTPGSFLLVQDGVIDLLSHFESARPGPLPAIENFLRGHPEFEVDAKRCERFIWSHHAKGWLRRRC